MSVTQYFKALADETRLRLLFILYKHELNVNELVVILSMGQSRVSRHLKILTDAGLLTSRRDGLWVFYSAPAGTPGRVFIDSLIPFMQSDPMFQTDLAMSAAVIEERGRKTQHFFNTIAEDWDRLAVEVLGDFNLQEAIAKLMPPCETACDLGCGTGNVLEVLLTKAQKVIGVDGSPRMLEMAKNRLPDTPNISLRIGDLSHLPLRDHEADFACLNLVLHHIPNPTEILKEVYRILQPEGYLVITDFTRHTDEGMRTEYGDHWLGFTKSDMEKFLADAGFSVTVFQTAPIERGLSLHIIQARRQPSAQ